MTNRANPAPVALFTYNRPRHTRITVEALLGNSGAEDTRVYVFSDAPRDEGAAPAVDEVRRYLRTIKGFGHLEIVERDTNLGLASSIVDGVTRLCSEHGRTIVLEDDLQTSPHFLRFMNDALDLYADDKSVMHVSGCTYPVGEFPNEGDTYFLRVPLCWGWATWSRAWSAFDRDLSVMNLFDGEMIEAFNFDGTYDYWKQMVLNRSGRLDTWFVFWYARVFLERGLALFPYRSLVRNVGHDGSGVNCSRTNIFEVEPSLRPMEVQRSAEVESGAAFEAHKRYFRSLTPGLARRVARRLKRLLYRD